MLSKILKAYNKGVDRMMLLVGNVPEREVMETFGGVPSLGHVGVVRIDETCILNGHKYVSLGPYQGAYEKIRAAKQKGETSVELTAEDFKGGAVLFNFAEIKELQEEAQAKGKNCLVKDLEVILDYESIFPKSIAPENPH